MPARDDLIAQEVDLERSGRGLADALQLVAEFLENALRRTRGRLLRWAAIEDAKRRKIIIGSTSEIHPEVNYRNAIAMYEAARNYRL